MNKINNGGPAFPIPHQNVNFSKPGMTLREWFAGQALAGLLTTSGGYVPSREQIARIAYEYADAVLAEGNKDGAE